MVNQTLWAYFADAGMVVKTVMVILLFASVMSWTFIIQRAAFYRKRKKALRTFQQLFWGGNDLSKLYAQIDATSERFGVERIFHAGFKEYLKQRQLNNLVGLKSIQRAMNIANSQELDELEHNLPLLASIGSTTPYIGLFGTVWGIMTSFHALGNVQQATISMVAPGISEALIATAMGLFAAIPAVLAYNRFSSQLDVLSGKYEVFQDELACVLEHQGAS